MLKIYIDRLDLGKEEKINESVDPIIMDIDENDLKFENPIITTGKVYLANDHLIFHLNIETTASMRCSICNELQPVKISIKKAFLTKQLDEIKGKEYNYSLDVRELILLEIPTYFECNKGNCPKRKTIQKFLKTSSAEQDNVYYPFAGLNEGES
ncbi:MAG TPA: hypothetical protein P5048_02130 [Chlamydiales bacterium]|nr:hypothetical protein [Chlamydiales bacterium]